MLLNISTMIKTTLQQIAEIQFGLYVQPENIGDAAYLQVKHFDDNGAIVTPVDAFTPIGTKAEGHLLQDGDVLLVGKGFRNFAWTYTESIGPAVASSVFFVLRARQSRVLPEFLSIIFNAPQTQAHLQTLGAGSSIPSIRKSELEAFPIPIPAIDVQKKIVEINRLHKQDLELSGRIIIEKKKMFNAVMQNLIYNND